MNFIDTDSEMKDKDIWVDSAKEEKRKFYRKQRIIRWICFIIGLALGSTLTYWVLGMIR